MYIRGLVLAEIERQAERFSEGASALGGVGLGGLDGLVVGFAEAFKLEPRHCLFRRGDRDRQPAR